MAINWGEIVRKRRRASDLGYIPPGQNVKDFVDRIQELEKLMHDETDPLRFVAINAAMSLDYIKDHIPRKWREWAVGILHWWRERQKEKKAPE